MTDRHNHYPANRPPEDYAAADRAAGFEVGADFERFDQRNDMFSRSFWDADVQSREALAFFRSHADRPATRKVDGFTQKDYALRNASWAVADDYADRNKDNGLREGFQDPQEPRYPPAEQKFVVDDPVAMAAEIKRVARLFGANMAGVTALDPRWLYATRTELRSFDPKPNDLPDGLTNVIVMGHGMDYDLVNAYPSALAGAAVGMGYSGEAATVAQLSQYIRNLGYQAVGSMNDTALVIPMAIQAGLGQYGRNQMVITKD